MRVFFLFLPLLTAFSLSIVAGCSFVGFGQKEYASNPDPNHTHIDFAVYIEDLKLDFSGNKYMSGLSTGEDTHEDAHEHQHEHLHLHDNMGGVIHQHKPMYTIGEFFDSIEFRIGTACLSLDTNVVICPDGNKVWKIFSRKKPLEGTTWQELPFDGNVALEDMEQILLTYQSNDEAGAAAIEEQKEEMPDDACFYSKTCPWRGDPPSESCLSDPEVPCVLPLD
jgi:hypothetical protein